MYTLDTIQLDVTSSAGSADHGQRPGRFKSGQCLRDIGNDLVGVHYAEVVIRDKSQDATALPR